MSLAKVPTLPHTLPLYEHILSTLKDAASSTANKPELQQLNIGIRRGLDKFMGYYNMARNNHFYIIATSTSVLRSCCDQFKQAIQSSIQNTVSHGSTRNRLSAATMREACLQKYTCGTRRSMATVYPMRHLLSRQRRRLLRVQIWTTFSTALRAPMSRQGCQHWIPPR